MKKLILVSALLCSFLFIPVFVSAQTAPTQEQLTQQLITLLTQLIAQLQQQINDILASQATLQNNFNQLQNTFNQTQPVYSTPPETPIIGVTTPSDSSTPSYETCGLLHRAYIPSQNRCGPIIMSPPDTK